MKDANDDLFFLGSSVCMNSVVPELFEKELHLSCFNGGANAQNLEYIDTMVDLILSHHTPKYIILSLRPYEIFMKTKERYNMFRIYYKHGFPKIDRYLEEGSFMDYLSLQSSFYRLNTYGWRLLLYHFKSYNELENGGFVGKPKLKIDPILIKQQNSTLEDDLPKPDPGKLECLNQIISQCQKKNIILIVTVPPAYYEIGLMQKYQCKVLGEYCRENNIPYYDDYYNQFFINHPELFYDNNHLNIDGAEIYTQHLLKKLKQHVKSN